MPATCLPKGMNRSGLSSTFDGEPWSGQLWSSHNDPLLDCADANNMPEVSSNLNGSRIMYSVRCGRYVVPAGFCSSEDGVANSQPMILTAAVANYDSAAAAAAAKGYETFHHDIEGVFVVDRTTPGRAVFDLSNVTAAAARKWNETVLSDPTYGSLEFPGSTYDAIVNPGAGAPSTASNPMVTVHNRCDYPAFCVVGGSTTAFEGVSGQIGVRPRESLTFQYSAPADKWFVIKRSSVHY